MDFLSAIVPDDGYTVFTTLEKNPNPNAKNPKRSVFHWRDFHDGSVQSFIDKFRTGDVDLYYSMATFRSKGDAYEGRTDNNVHLLKALWLDIDAGAEKFAKHPNDTYPDFNTAWNALQSWLDAAQMWEPSYIVSSGEGLHVYWALTRPVSPDVWRSLSAGLRKLARQHGLKLDAGVSMRMSGILRVPGTIHTKSGNTVKILSSAGGLFTVDELREAIPFVDTTSDTNTEFGALPDHLRGDDHIDEAWDLNQQKFSMQKLMDLSLAGKGCEQMALSYEDQPGTSYPLWRGTLSIAATCIDGDEWVHKISDQHPGYSAAYTEKIADGCRGMPYTCERWQELDPTPCENCPLLGKIKSPIVLGRVIDEATPEQIIQLANSQPQAPKREVKPEQEAKLTLLAREIADTTVKPLALPKGYSYSVDGGLIHTKKDGEQSIIYRYPLLLLNRVYSPVDGEALIMQVNLPYDEPRIFQIPLAAMVSDDKLRAVCAANGVMATTKEQWAEIMSFLRRAADQSMDQRRADRQHQHYGWTDDMSAFVIGNTEYDTEGNVRPMVLPQDEGRLDKAFHVSPEANIGEFLKATDLIGTKGLELSQFIMGVGLSAPLFQLMNLQGCLVHCWAPDSGVGKTTTTQLATALWGRPVVSGGTGLMALERDTATAMYIKLGQLNSIATVVDEITKRRGDELSDMVYAITQGRDKDRGQAQANKLRDNQGNWSMAIMSTGNLSVTQQLINMDALSEALNARVIELNFSGTKSLWGPNMENKAMVETTFHSAVTTHAGTVGRDFIRHVLTNQMAIRQMFYELEQECSQYFGFSQKERFWNNTVCCALLAIKLGNDLGYWDYDVEAIKAKLRAVLCGTREKVENSRVDGETLLSMFMASTVQNRITVTSANNTVPGGSLPNGEIGIREETDTGTLRITDSFLRKWCEANGKSVDQFYDQLRTLGGTTTRDNLMRGISAMASRVTELVWVVRLKEGESEDA